MAFLFQSGAILFDFITIRSLDLMMLYQFIFVYLSVNFQGFVLG